MYIDIRRATTNDAGLIADLSRETFYDSFAKQNTKENMDKFMNEQFTYDALKEEVSAPGNIFLLAYHENTPTGYARLRDSKPAPGLENIPSIELARIYARTASIGTGTGSALMKASLDITSQLQRSVIWLGVWEHNQRAIGFYTKWGFAKFGEHEFLLGDDRQTDWLMKKNL